MADAIITAKGLGYQLGSRFLLKNINWEIAERSRWIIIGMNGSGKTTLLSILAGYRAFNHGELLYRGQPYDSYNIFDLRRKMGWISGSFFDQVYKNESVMDILLSGRTGTYGVEEEDALFLDIIKIKKLLRCVGLEDRLDAPFGWLSKGERQSGLIVRAILANPEILVFDEPMTGLDVLARESIRRFIGKIGEDKKHTMIYVTHHLDEISPSFFDHCMLLKHGQIFRKGKTEEIFTLSVISDFLGVPTEIEQDKNGCYVLGFNSEVR
ncbi:MAG: ATP-binding cassette domain-containing protein [Peptococcaceae bacterium]|nr:ATP-binding cassette domain-containing protein [Peptococcaceae bacterium]